MNIQHEKIAIIGPESTGKSTLTKSLAEEFGEPWVPEYAREYLLASNGKYAYDDLLKIAKGQIDLESRFESQANRFLFCDTDLQVIDVWSQHKFGKTHPWIKKTIAERKYSFYLLTDIDIPWQDDPLREHPEPHMRRYFFENYHHRVMKSGIPYKIISGTHEERLYTAKSALLSHFV